MRTKAKTISAYSSIATEKRKRHIALSVSSNKYMFVMELLKSLDCVKIEDTIVINELKQSKNKTLGDFFGRLNEQDYSSLKKQTEKARKEWNRSF